MSVCSITSDNFDDLAKMLAAFTYFLMGSLFGFEQWDPLHAASCCVLLPCSCYSLKASLLCGAKRCSRLIFYFPYPILECQCFFKKSLFLLLRNGIQKPIFGCQVCLLLLRCYCFQTCSADRGKKYMCMCTYMHTNLYSYIYRYIKNNELILVTSISFILSKLFICPMCYVNNWSLLFKNEFVDI